MSFISIKQQTDWGAHPYFSKPNNYLPKIQELDQEIEKEMKILEFTENADYGPEANCFALAKIDRRAGTCETRLSNDQDLADKYGYSRICLEEIGNFFQEDCKSIVHYHSANLPEDNSSSNIRKFLELIEKQLNLDKKSIVFNTDEPKVTAIRVAPFWLKNTLKRRLFLIIIKEGKYFNEAAGLDSILANGRFYLSQVQNFFKLFLAGYTKFDQKCLDKVYRDFHHGIVAQFKNLTEDQIKDILVFKE